MNISEVPTRDAEDAWIEKYRKALEAAPTQRAPKQRLDELLVRLTRNLASNLGRLVDRWRQPKRRLPARAESNSAVLNTATPISKKRETLASDPERAQMAS